MKAAAAACLTLTLAGCATFADAPPERLLPVSPSYARPVEVSEPRRGEDPVEVAARERAGRVAANGRLTRFGAWYSCVRSDYAAEHDKICR